MDGGLVGFDIVAVLHKMHPDVFDLVLVECFFDVKPVLVIGPSWDDSLTTLLICPSTSPWTRLSVRELLIWIWSEHLAGETLDWQLLLSRGSRVAGIGCSVFNSVDSIRILKENYDAETLLHLLTMYCTSGRWFNFSQPSCKPSYPL